MDIEIIIFAIEKQRVLTVTYKGSIRTVEPHALGIDHNGDVTLSCWQRSGGSGEGFRDLHIDRIDLLAVTDQTFPGPRSGYSRNSKKFSRVFCRL